MLSIVSLCLLADAYVTGGVVSSPIRINRDDRSGILLGCNLLDFVPLCDDTSGYGTQLMVLWLELGAYNDLTDR